MDSSQLKAFWADVLSKSLSCFGVDNSSTVLDCCARDTGLVFALMDHFSRVGSNDLTKTCPTQTHFDIRDPAYWKAIQAKYAGIVTEPPRNPALILTILNNAFSIGTKFCALLLSKFDNTNFLIQCPPSMVVLVDGLQQSLFLWLNPAIVGTRLVSLTGDIVTAYQSEPTLFGEAIRSEVTRVCQVTSGFSPSFNTQEPAYAPSISCVTASSMASNTGMLSYTSSTQVSVSPSEAESPFSSKSDEDDSSTDVDQKTLLYLKGIAAANQGQALQEYIEKYSSVFSKREVITKVCKMKYRSAQRKLRIAKYIASYPEISGMTQRQAEKYISEKLKQNKPHLTATRRRKLNEAEQNALLQNLPVY